MAILDEVRQIELPSISDHRGVLTSIEGGEDIPFEIRRIFYMHHFLDDRGGHAHKDTDQVIVAISGSFELLISDGNEKQKIVLDNPIKGVFIPRLLFVDIYNCSNNSVCLVLANTHYDISKSFRSWDEYIQHIHG